MAGIVVYAYCDRTVVYAYCDRTNSGTCGAFDLTTLWGVDSEIAADMVTVFALIARVSSYPDSLGYESDFKSIVGAWRPELVD